MNHDYTPEQKIAAFDALMSRYGTRQYTKHFNELVLDHDGQIVFIFSRAFEIDVEGK